MLDDSEEQQVKQAIVNTVVDNYDLIAQSQDANRRVEALAGAAQGGSNKLRESLIKLQTQTKNMVDAGSIWRRRKQILSSASAQHQKLLALAEAPSLMEECIRGEMYHEALLVMEHMLRSHQQTDQSSGFFARAADHMRTALEHSIVAVVLPKLSGPLSVDGSFKICTFLRRLGVHPQRLKELFLACRTVYVDRLVAEAEGSPAAYSRMLRHINVYKVHVSEVVLQYSACFPAGATDVWDVELRQWCHGQARRFSATFATIVRGISNSSELALVVEQCAGCSTSTAKLHMDVASLLNGLLVERVKDIFAEHMRHAHSAYAASMRTFSWRVPPSHAALYGSAAGGAGATGAEDASAPPLSLAQWLPLAYALNGILTAFNAVRKCLLPGAQLFCAEQVAMLVGRIAEDLRRDGELADTMEDAERRIYCDLVAAFAGVFYPHVTACTGKLLGVESMRWVQANLAGGVEALARHLPAPEEELQAIAVDPTPPHSAAAPPAPVPAVPAAPSAAAPMPTATAKTPFIPAQHPTAPLSQPPPPQRGGPPPGAPPPAPYATAPAAQHADPVARAQPSPAAVQQPVAHHNPFASPSVVPGGAQPAPAAPMHNPYSTRDSV